MKLVIPRDILDMIETWVASCEGEVSGLGKIVATKDGYEVKSAYLLDQMCTAAYTEIAPDAVTKLMMETIKEEGHLNWWWHSHAHMGVFWSATDYQQINEMAANGMCLATVFNKKGDSRTAYAQVTDGFFGTLFIDDITTVVRSSNESKMGLWLAQAAEKVKKWPEPPAAQVTGEPTNRFRHEGKYFTEDTLAMDFEPVAEEDIDGLTVEELRASKKLLVPYQVLDAVYRAYLQQYEMAPYSAYDINSFYSNEYILE